MEKSCSNCLFLPLGSDSEVCRFCDSSGNNWVSKKKVKTISTLPNKKGFKFFAVMKNGTVKEDVVRLEDGIHKISDYQNTIGWIGKNIKLSEL